MFCGMPSRLILMSRLLLRGNNLDDGVRKTISNWILLFPTSIAQRYLEILWSGSVRMSFLLSIVLKFARVECWIDDFGSTNLLFLDHSKQLFMDVASQSKVNMNINTKYRFGFLSFLLILNKCLMLSYQWAFFRDFLESSTTFPKVLQDQHAMPSFKVECTVKKNSRRQTFYRHFSCFLCWFFNLCFSGGICRFSEEGKRSACVQVRSWGDMQTDSLQMGKHLGDRVRWFQP